VTDLPRLAIRLHGGIDSRRCAALARHAEACGFNSVWFAENPYQRGVLPSATACAIATERINIGIGIFNPYNRHPTLMAMEIGALDEISDGRAMLGIGSGVPEWINKIVPYDKPLSGLRDAALIARSLLSGEAVSHEGVKFSARGVKLEFNLARDRVPLYLAAMADRSLKLCGELADGLIIGNMCPPSYTRRAIKIMNEGAKKAGRPVPSEIVKYIPCVVRSDSEAARNAVKPAIAATLAAYWELYKSAPNVRSTIIDDSGISADAFIGAMERAADGESATQALSDSFVAAYAVAGTAEECFEQCRILGRNGVTELALSFLSDEPEADMSLFSEAIAARHHA